MTISRIEKTPTWIIHLLAIIGFSVFAYQAWSNAQSQMSVLDEGLYLYKGWLFASGDYTLFQDFGPWSNHMPLSFLIPGWFQLVVGPGLLSGRILAILCGLLTVLGLWILTRRLGGNWWAVLSVWAVALNPAVIKIYSFQTSQVLVACILIWALVFILGQNRPTWQLVAGSIMIGAIPLTRINLMPVFPMAVVYIYWQHGKKAGHLALTVTGLVFLVGHAVYWPGILRMWAPWFPDSITPFLDPFRGPPNDGAAWSPQIGIKQRVLSFLQGTRFHFVALMAVLVSLITFPGRKWLKRIAEDKALVFLVTLFLVLFSTHAWVSLSRNYCVFCFSTYLSFFSFLGLIIGVIAYKYLAEMNGNAGRHVWWILLIVVCAIGLSTFNTIGESFVQQTDVVRFLVRFLRTQIQRSTGEGSFPIWGFIENLTGRDFENQVSVLLVYLRMGLGIVLGFIGMLAVYILAKKWRFAGSSFPLRIINLFFAASLFFSSTAFLGGGYRTYDCSGNVIAAYEDAGAYLSDIIKPGSRVFWVTFNSPIPLLYLQDVEIYPQQLNGLYSLKNGGDPQALARFGHWNKALAVEWLSESDVVLLSSSVFRDQSMSWLVEIVENGDFREQPSTNQVHPCEPDSRILIYLKE
jgi:hypothetical protein